jgi:hypothetical protein
VRTKVAVALVAVLGLVWVGIAAGAEIAGLVAPAALLAGLWLHAKRRTRRPHQRVHPRRRDAVPTQWLTGLDAHASKALLDADDCVRTSDQELAVAASRLGPERAAPFRAALTAARTELAAAFRLRQMLDDGIPRTNAVRQSMMLDVNSRCTEVSRLLDEQAPAFDAAQDRAEHGPRILAEVEVLVDQLSARLQRSRQVLAQLAARYSPQAMETVAINPDLAAALLRMAVDGLATAGQLLEAGEPGAGAARARAAASLQIAEAAAGQASGLLDGIKHQEAELTQAASALPAAVRETSADLAEAEPLLDDGPSSALSRARAAVVAAAGDRLDGGPFDALAALRAVEQACATLDHALARSRAEPVRQHRAEAILDQAMLVARSSVRAAEDFVATRRGAVGSPARTRLAAAWRHFEQAIACVQADPRAALNEAGRADGLAHQATSLAAHDVAAFNASSSHAELAAGVLAGILMGGAGNDAQGPADSPGPASFGGTATRARHVPRHDSQAPGDGEPERDDPAPVSR